MFIRALLCRESHRLAIVCVREAIADDTIDHGLVPVAGAGARRGNVVRRIGHRLGTACDHDVGTAGKDRLGTEDDGFHTGGTDFVDGGADGGVREAGDDCTLAGRVLAQAAEVGLATEGSFMMCFFYSHSIDWTGCVLCGENISKENFLDLGCLDGRNSGES